MAGLKRLWRGVFKYPGGAVVVEYTYSYSRDQARVIMCQRLAKRDGVHPSVVLGMFDDGDNYTIETEMEIKEVE